MKSCPITNIGQDLTSISQKRSENNLSDHESTNIGYIKRIRPVFKKAKKIAMKGILKGKLLRGGTSSAKPVVDEEISIHTGLPKNSTRTSKWPEQHNMVLGELLLEQFLYGNMLNGVLRKDLWVELVSTLNRRLDTIYTVPMVMIRFKNMKADFREIYQLSNSSGWGWDEERKMPIASDEIWDDLIKVRPKMARFRRNPFRQYEIFEKICGENIAIGTIAYSNIKKKKPTDVEDEDVVDVHDDFMSANGVSYINEEDVLERQNGSENFETPAVDIIMEPLRGVMANFLRGTFTEEMCAMIDAQIEFNSRICELTSSLLNDVDSSDEDESVPRPMFTRSYSGAQYVSDVLAGHPVRSYNCFRLHPDAFVSFRDLLVSRGLLADTKNITVAEQLGIFLRGVGHAHSYRQLCEFFQHSLETVSRHFNSVLRAIVSLSDEMICFPPANAAVHPVIRTNPQYHPFFRNAIGAIDGTHVPAIVGRDMQNRFRNRKGFTSQNVIAAVSFDRQFTFIGVGWEGSAADMRVMRWAIEEGGLIIPNGKYYLVDSGYANTEKLIAPFRGYRYHLSEYRSSTTRRYLAEQDLFNHRHAQLRNVVERTFGIWKERFQVLSHMRQFPIKVQADIVIACAILHNYIGRYHGDDSYFHMSQTEMSHDNQLGEVAVDDEDPNSHATVGERVTGEVIRHDIATSLWDARLSQRRNST